MPDDPAFADLISRLAEALQRGEAIDLELQCAAHPEWAADLRALWGTVLVTHELAAGEASHPAETAAPSAAPTDLPQVFGDFVLESELGRGGMGVVYRARQLSLDRHVALKLILQGSRASPEERRRFRAEAESAAKLTHPNIVTITSVGEHDGQVYFCMELIRGGTLTQKLADGPLSPRLAAQILLAVTRAVSYAHHQGILHRDLKPSNILIGTSGTPYVADFGLAKLLDPGTETTASDRIVGTPAYMAPEQAARTPGAVGPACDIYSLGAILYFMLTGQPPFAGATALDTMLMVLEQEPMSPRLINRQADRDLEMICLKCLQKPPDLRYETAADLAKDLEAYLENEPIAARDGRLGQVVATLFRETHYAGMLENWGLLWMWHSLVLFAACLATNALHWSGNNNRWHYWLLWTVGFGAWAVAFWWLRRRMGPVTFMERLVAHVWLGSLISVASLFPLEAYLGLPVLSLSPALGLVAGMVFLFKAGILSGTFYVHAAVMFATAYAMALWPEGAQVLFGVTSGACFFIAGLKYHRLRRAHV